MILLISGLLPEDKKQPIIEIANQNRNYKIEIKITKHIELFKFNLVCFFIKFKLHYVKIIEKQKNYL